MRKSTLIVTQCGYLHETIEGAIYAKIYEEFIQWLTKLPPIETDV